MRIPALLIAVIVITSFGCNKSSDPAPTPNPGPDVYAAGYERNIAGIEVAKYWKNGVAVSLSDGTKDNYATGIFVVGNDVYVSGMEIPGPNAAITKFWKNGVETILLPVAHYANSGIFVTGTDVYVSSNEPSSPNFNSHARYLKNGVLNILPESSGAAGSVSTGIYVDGSDVYVSGYIYFPPSIGKPVIWKNGVEIDQPVPVGYNGRVTSVVVKGSDVYGSGYIEQGYSSPIYWKNGFAVNLPKTPNVTAQANGIDVVGSDVYVTGYEFTSSAGNATAYAKCWKNGVGQNISDGSLRAECKCIKVFNGDIYIGGDEFVPASPAATAKYWKNGVAVNLTNGSRDAGVNAIFVQ